jgi:hypothetical protein
MHTTSLGTAQQQSKLSPVIAALGAAFIAAGITLAISMNGGTTTAGTQELASVTPKACQQMARKLLVSTTAGSGTVRLREGSYLSPPIKLSTVPQSVVFPLSRPDTIAVEEVLTIEGNANDVVITSEVTNLRRVFDVQGVTAFNITWKAVKGC